MPVKLVEVKGIKGYRYGNSGHLYPVKQFGDKGAREKAQAQGTAILYSQGKIKEAQENSHSSHSTPIRGDSQKRGTIRRKF